MSNLSTPSAADLAQPVTRFVIAPGVTIDMLRPYWQQHPELSHPMPGNLQTIQIATWRDLTLAAVPTDASPETLAHFYIGARIVYEMLSDVAEIFRDSR